MVEILELLKDIEKRLARIEATIITEEKANNYHKPASELSAEEWQEIRSKSQFEG